MLPVESKIWRLKFPAQPLVFCFASVSALCEAVMRLYGPPGFPACLSMCRGRYYLAVSCGLRQRRQAAEAVGRLGECLGPARVLYSYCAEHGRELSRDAVAELGRALKGRDNED